MKIDAPAKINLALHVVGQRSDGYHLIESVVTFINVSDVLSLAPATNLTLNIDGPEAVGLPNDHQNLVIKAAQSLALKGDIKALGADICLTKNLPIASGIGGGSADAAAALKALNTFWSVHLSDPQLKEIGLPLGADIPMCLNGKPLLASGIGEVLEEVSMPDFHMVLVNPRISVSTPKIFNSLPRKDNAPLPALPRSSKSGAWIDWLSETRNDLQEAAIEFAPQIRNCLLALTESNAQFARMSGSGATCFGIYQSQRDAKNAAASIRLNYPDWWVSCGQTKSGKTNAD